ncbi:histidinol-phosphate transaminase [Pontibacter sp. SGAir0037]|nr:histidinol-phosphate transaminase [Pontibacter sp. SGAir0037]
MNHQTSAYYAASNENLFGVSPKVTAALASAFHNIYSYPCPDAHLLREAIAQKLGVLPQEISIGSGSAELISLLIRTFCRPYHTTSILSVNPTYPLYKMEADTLGVQYIEAPLDSSYNFDVDCILRKVDASTCICFISNPNNPTGTYLTRQGLERLVYELPEHVLLVVDEAYIEYVNAPDFADALSYRNVRQNLIVLRTFSKAYGLASLRVGYMIAGEKLQAALHKIKQPFNVNQMAQVAALAVLEDEDFLNHTIQSTAFSKLYLQQHLSELGIQYWPSQGNFLMIDAGIPATVLYQQLLQNGIQVRQTTGPFTLRITVGQQPYQDYLIYILKNILNPTSLMQHPSLSQVLKTGETFANAETTDKIAASQALTQEASNMGTAEERIAFAFARAFDACLAHTSNHTGNLYSSTYGMMDMISAFNVLVKSTPLVTFGHLFSSLSIQRAVAGASAIHILDLGIGGGLQWFTLLELLASRPEGAPQVRLTGIDIPASADDPEQKLRATGEALKQHAQQLGIDFSYTGIASKLEDINLKELILNPSEALVINSAFTLHHIPDQLVIQPDERDKVLLQIKALSPVIFTLTEPDSEHNKLDFLPRLRESLRHYYTVFDVLDTLLPSDMPERQVIEQEFFAREIINIISCEDSQRVERHERNEAWQRRLVRVGFTPFEQEPLADQIVSTLQLHENFELQANGAGYTLLWKNTPIVAATAWR